MKWNWKSIQLSKNCAEHTKNKPLISFPTWLTLWKDTINPQWPVHYYTFLVLLLIEIVQFNSSVSEIQSRVPLMARNSSRKTLKNENRKSISTSYYNGPWGGFVYVRSYYINSLIYFFIRSGTEASLFWASLVLVLDILWSVLHRFWLFYRKGL